MRIRNAAIIVALTGLASAHVVASGQAGIYGIVERVVFEPDARSPERVQIWGAFALIERGGTAYPGGRYTEVEGQVFTNFVHLKPTRGYLYFRLPDVATEIENGRREWSDLASVAGTQQAVAFGYWDRSRGDKLMRVRDKASKPENPDPYYTDVGVAKLAASGNHATIVSELRKLLER
jgi:hypothetical protein